MDLTYETGFLLSLIIFAWSLLDDLMIYLSFQIPNFKKIGKRYSYWTRDYVDIIDIKQKSHWLSTSLYFFLIVAFRFSFVFLSWLYVAYSIFNYALTLRESILMPDSVKRYRWKMKNTNMHRDDVIKESLILADKYNEENFKRAKLEVQELLDEAG